MTSSREQISLKGQIADDQLLCWNCEEIVHTSALSCPYCNASLKNTITTSGISTHSKITQLIPTQEKTLPQESPSKEPVITTGPALATICLLFGGCNILFLGILIALFSREGSFSLSWPEAHWPAYFGLGIALTAFGLMTLKKVEQ